MAVLILFVSLSGMALAEDKTITVSEPNPTVIDAGVKSTVTYQVTVSGYETALDASCFGIYLYGDLYSFTEFSSLMSAYYGTTLSIEKDSKTYKDGAQHFVLKIKFSGSNIAEVLREFRELDLYAKPEETAEYDEAYGAIYLPKYYLTSVAWKLDDYSTVPDEISNGNYRNW